MNRSRSADSSRSEEYFGTAADRIITPFGLWFPHHEVVVLSAQFSVSASRVLQLIVRPGTVPCDRRSFRPLSKQNYFIS